MALKTYCPRCSEITRSTGRVGSPSEKEPGPSLSSNSTIVHKVVQKSRIGVHTALRQSLYSGMLGTLQASSRLQIKGNIESQHSLKRVGADMK